MLLWQNTLLLFLPIGAQIVSDAVCVAVFCTAAPMHDTMHLHAPLCMYYFPIAVAHQLMQTALLFAITTATLLIAAVLASVHAPHSKF